MKLRENPKRIVALGVFEKVKRIRSQMNLKYQGSGTQGWRQFLTERERMLDAFDRAKQRSRSDKVKVEHGNVAESEFRHWLERFLPKRFGVTAGKIICQALGDSVLAPNYDVIIYDQLNSPVLWTEENSGRSSNAVVRAIPAEHVSAIFEILRSHLYRLHSESVKHSPHDAN